MFPVLFQYKFLSINGYGLMLGIGFYLSFLLLEREFKLKDINPDLAYKILLIAIPGGIVGSKIADMLEHLDSYLQAPVDMIFSGSGLSAFGGYVLSFFLAILIIKKSKENVLKVFDAGAPALALGYCFGRFGCHVAGDGCYGLDTISFFGTPYPNGIVPTSAYVFPTPLFEVMFSAVAVGILLNMRKYNFKPGRLFFSFLILSGLPRFLVEFIRLNPKLLFNLTQAQFIGLAFIVCGITGWIYTGIKDSKPKTA